MRIRYSKLSLNTQCDIRKASVVILIEREKLANMNTKMFFNWYPFTLPTMFNIDEKFD